MMKTKYDDNQPGRELSEGILMMLTITPVSWTMTMVEVMTMRARGKKKPRVKRKML